MLTLTTARDAKVSLLHTVDVRDDEGHKPAAFDFAGTPAEKAALLVAHLDTVTAQTVAAEQLRRGTKIAKIDKCLAAVHPSLSLARIAGGEFR